MNAPHKIIDHLRNRAGVAATKIGPIVGMSTTWGQRVLDGSICPNLPQANKLAKELYARKEERLRLLEAVSRTKLSRAGINGENLEKVIRLLLRLYE